MLFARSVLTTYQAEVEYVLVAAIFILVMAEVKLSRKKGID